ncbi:hypothetical protein [Brevibacterium renqingii]|uniref:hypothetical protein n=1 Tax=Brevibacterium renqingii TaxID=2776916 RepID=UPI001AE04358|nr:hypothetical protein [Brevibacterium renqingii]
MRGVVEVAIITPIVLSTAEAERIRRDLVSNIGDVDDFKARAESYQLDTEDRALYDDLIEIEFLLGR